MLLAKACPRCRQIKRSEAYSRHTNRADGLQAWCKACVSAYQRSRYVPKRSASGVKRSGVKRSGGSLTITMEVGGYAYTLTLTGGEVVWEAKACAE